MLELAKYVIKIPDKTTATASGTTKGHNKVRAIATPKQAIAASENDNKVEALACFINFISVLRILISAILSIKSSVFSKVASSFLVTTLFLTISV